MKQKFKYIYSVFITAIISVIVYLITHELGHALTAVMYGSEITQFSVVNAHVWWIGNDISDFGNALILLAGTLFPVLLTIVCIFFYNKHSNNLAYHLLYGFGTLVSALAVLSWVFIPIISMYTAPPADDDVTKFLQYASVISPDYVSVSGTLVFISISLLAYKKGLFQKIIYFFKSASQSGNYDKISFKTVFLLTVIAIILISAAVVSEMTYIS